MPQQLRQILAQYLEGVCDRAALEDWFLTNLQVILDSNDDEAIELANALDVLFLKLHDGVITNEQFLERTAALSFKPRTVVRPLPTSVSTASGSQTYSSDPNQADRLVPVA